MPPFLARPDTTISRTATANAAAPTRAEDDVVINMAELGQDPDSKNKDTLFGPSIGVINNGPKWAQSPKSKAAPGDELTPEVVRSWVKRSKEVREYEHRNQHERHFVFVSNGCIISLFHFPS